MTCLTFGSHTILRFEKTYLGTIDINGRSGALFAIEDWNFYEVTVQGREIARTNNYVEGFHRGFAGRFTGAHPPMMKFVNAVKQQQRATDFILNRLNHEIDDSGKRGSMRAFFVIISGTSLILRLATTCW